MRQLDLPGYAIGGLSVGELKEEMHAVLELVDGLLPEDKPRYLMGVGTPEDLVNGVLRGIDIFDCVLPTRLARHNAAMTRTGRLNLVNSAFSRDFTPIESGCQCYTCQNFSRAYLRHLIIAKEMLSATLLSIHNLSTMLQLSRDLRQAVIENRLERFAADFFRASPVCWRNSGHRRRIKLIERSPCRTAHPGSHPAQPVNYPA